MKRRISRSIHIPSIYDDAYLSFLEGERHVPFRIKRIYVIYKCVPGLNRGHHAHKKTHQAIFCLQGSFDLFLDDGRTKKMIHINKPDIGAEIPPLVWHEMRNLSGDAILMVVASEYYRKSDYIRDYDKFISFIKKSHG